MLKRACVVLHGAGEAVALGPKSPAGHWAEWDLMSSTEAGLIPPCPKNCLTTFD